MNEKNLRFSLKAPLNIGDTETQTYGCRANNPDICKNCYVDGICAFTTKIISVKLHQLSGKNIF